MEKWIEKFFNLKEVPTKLILVLLVTSSLLLFAPDNWISNLNLTEFIGKFGKYLGITFIVCTGFMTITLISYFTKLINRKLYSFKLNRLIIESVLELDFHEKALLREFYINGKGTLQLPMNNETVVGLINKGIIYQAAPNGFVYIDGAYYIYSISKKAKFLLQSENIDLPINPSEREKEWLKENRPQWAKTKSKIESLASW